MCVCPWSWPKTQPHASTRTQGDAPQFFSCWGEHGYLNFPFSQDACCSFQPLAFYQWGGGAPNETKWKLSLTVFALSWHWFQFYCQISWCFFFFLLWLCLFSIFCQDLKVHIFPMTPGSSHLCSIIPRHQFQEGRASPWGLPRTLVFSWTPFLNLTGLNSK